MWRILRQEIELCEKWEARLECGDRGGRVQVRFAVRSSVWLSLRTPVTSRDCFSPEPRTTAGEFAGNMSSWFSWAKSSYRNWILIPRTPFHISSIPVLFPVSGCELSLRKTVKSSARYSRYFRSRPSPPVLCLAIRATTGLQLGLDLVWLCYCMHNSGMYLIRFKYCSRTVHQNWILLGVNTAMEANRFSYRRVKVLTPSIVTC